MNEEIRNEMGSEVPRQDNKSECNSKAHLLFKIISLLSLAGIIVLFILFFLPEKQDNTTKPSEVSFAFVDTDTLLGNYDFVDDVEIELADLEKRFQDQYAASANALQKEYNDYLKKGTAGLLTLSEQKKTEEKLAKKQEDLAALNEQLTQQLMMAKQLKNMEVHDTIVNYIARYNQKKKFTFVFEKAYGVGLLFANQAYDITQEVLVGLNKEYEKIKAENDAESEESEENNKE